MPAQTLSPFVAASLDAAHLDDPGTATGRTLGWGVVSTADIAEKVVPDIAALPDARLVAVSSRDQERAEDFARRHGVARAYGGTATTTGLDRLAADPDVEIVYVATPHGYHHRDVSALLRAGKHVVCEKALAMTAAEVRDLLRLAREHGVFLMEAVWTRMTPGFRTAMRWIQEGRLGRVRSVEGSIGMHRPLDPAHRLFRRADGGGVLLDMMVYPLTWTSAVLGTPERWSARAELGATDVDLDTALTLDFGHGRAHVSGTLSSTVPHQVTISGTEGWLRVDGRINCPTTLVLQTAAGARGGAAPVVAHVDVPGAGYVFEMREATRCVQRGLLESPVMPWADSLELVELFDRVRERIGVRYPHDAH
ncbi:Gfo/Idh/MocA family protein [uncultured Kocuria sp.]|uniref:Gfo/Idh/MocA family protein n=1 Tax=uncultured Kocuria sp. TaxID=259305 RepID=UPI00261618F2|nr:Gfo/Idh/MocA family oxidoreductase [uncultured Kocuria sp.]